VARPKGRSGMTDEISFPNFQQADALLSDLLAEAQKWGGTLAGGKTQNLTAEAIAGLFKTKVSFGNPIDTLIRLTEDTFKNCGTDLNIQIVN